MTDHIFKKISKIIYPIYLVGGALRDKLMHIPLKDYDLATPLNPDIVEEKLRKEKYRTFAIGKRFGTIGTIIEGHQVEITTFRTEQYQMRTRKPKVSFGTDLQEDLLRRDFTINAMAIDKNGQIKDPFDGQKDIHKKIIRCVGNPHERFREDPLRMLRAARFAAQLGFSVEKRTKEAIAIEKEDILYISKERWLQEMDKILLSRYPVKGLQLLKSTGLIQMMLKDFHVKSRCVLRITQLNDIDKQWAKLLKIFIKPSDLSKKSIQELSLFLRWPKKRRKAIVRMFDY